jgi:hypothetical protein
VNTVESKTSQVKPAPLFIWWIIWFAIVSGLVVIYFFLGRADADAKTAKEGPLQYVGLAPLVTSCILRWLIFPRQTEAAKAFVVFIMGLSLAEGCGIMSLVLGGGMKLEIFLLALIGVLQWAPLNVGHLFEAQRSPAHGLRSP